MNDQTWTRLVVTGEAVSPEQAGEILLRTNSWWGFSFTHREWANSVAFTVSLELHAIGQPSKESLEDLLQRFQVLPLKNLYNSRIACRFLNGPRGWCDWSGRIHASSYDIGPYAEPEDIDADWRAIAHAFPFLRLDAQILERGVATHQWRVALGTARQVPPRDLLTAVTQAPAPGDRAPEDERCFTTQQLEAAVERLDVKLHGRSLAEEFQRFQVGVLL